MNEPTIFGNKNYDQPALFTPANLLREARRQKDRELGIDNGAGLEGKA